MTRLLSTRFRLGSRDLVAFVGGGGKSTLILGLGRELSNDGRPVVMTTTTKMGHNQLPDWATVCRTPQEVRSALRAGHPAFLVRAIDGAKVLGVEPQVVDDLYATTEATVLVEADGARRRPFKAPGPSEPVIPTHASLVVVVVGLDALGRPIAEACHRPERVAAITGKTADDSVTAADIALVVNHGEGGRKRVPPEARLVLALTKATEDHRRSIDEITAGLAPDIAAVVVPAD